MSFYIGFTIARAASGRHNDAYPIEAGIPTGEETSVNDTKTDGLPTSGAVARATAPTTHPTVTTTLL
ncbi:MAG: hypothetical protein JXA33_09740 [Anaerolineae bacterium]|nr:hypothetical protein [Anaerolineae bacterium]